MFLYRHSFYFIYKIKYFPIKVVLSMARKKETKLGMSQLCIKPNILFDSVFVYLTYFFLYKQDFVYVFILINIILDTVQGIHTAKNTCCN